MNALIGLIIVCASVAGGYIAMGGNIMTLWQPFEVIIIVGSAIGAYIIGNSTAVLRDTLTAVGQLMRGPRYNRDDFLELLSALYGVFRIAHKDGVMALDRMLEDPGSQEPFRRHPSIVNNVEAMGFLTDYLRLISLGAERPEELEALIAEDIDTKRREYHRVSSALQRMADALPALGIVAAVLGVIKTMGSIDQPPEVLGSMIGGAMVGTFLGVLLSYGAVGPLAARIRTLRDQELKYFDCIRVALLAYLEGYAPAICAEYARKVLYQELQPTFEQVEEVTSNANRRQRLEGDATGDDGVGAGPRVQPA